MHLAYMHKGACSVAATYKPPMLVPRARLPAGALALLDQMPTHSVSEHKYSSHDARHSAGLLSALATLQDADGAVQWRGRKKKLPPGLFLYSIYSGMLSRGTWCSGITSAPHAEGPGLNPQCVHAQKKVYCVHVPDESVRGQSLPQPIGT